MGKGGEVRKVWEQEATEQARGLQEELRQVPASAPKPRSPSPSLQALPSTRAARRGVLAPRPLAFPRGRGGGTGGSRHAHALQRLLILGPAAAVAAGDRGAAVTPGAAPHCSRMKDLNNPPAAPCLPTPNAHSHPLSFSLSSARSRGETASERPSQPLLPGAPPASDLALPALP